MQDIDETRKNLLIKDILNSKINNKYIKAIDCYHKNISLKKDLAKAILQIELYFRPRIISFLEYLLVFSNIILYALKLTNLKNYTVGHFQIGIKTSLRWTKNEITISNYIQRFFLLNKFIFAYRIFIIGLNNFIKSNISLESNFIDNFAIFYNGNSFSKNSVKYSEMLKIILREKNLSSNTSEIINFINKLQKFRRKREENVKHTKTLINSIVNIRFNNLKLLINKENIFCATLMIASIKKNKIVYYKSYGNYINKIPVLETRRLVGSILKIALYSAYIETFNAQLNEIFIDKPIEIINNNQKFVPKNSDNKFRGEVSLEYAFANSINSVAIQILMKLGINNFINYLRKYGITIPLPRSPLLALGAIKLTGQEILYLFSPIINNGFLNWTQTKNSNTKTIPLNNGKKILSQSTIVKMKTLLQATTLYGTAKFLNKYNTVYKIYGKTGTSEGNKDLWFIGTINKNLYGLIWLGSNNEENITSIDSYPISASRIAVPVWHDILKVYFDYVDDFIL